jgi:Leucine-rich repeat (LRR) protein
VVGEKQNHEGRGEFSSCISIFSNLQPILLKNLGSLKRLKILALQSNRITKLEGLEELENLEDLHISHNGIQRIEGLERNVCAFSFESG